LTAGKVDLVNRAWTGVIAFAIVALGAAAVYFVYASKQNRDAADRWQSKAGALERTLTARTRQLNTRTEALNKAAASLKRSEQDVDDLEDRQRQLANEKAQVEDARGALELQATSLATIAGEQRQCTSQLTELLNRYAAEDFAWVDANADAVSATCAQAQTDFETFQSQFG
jgi:septal ring factor EnvC (AmiA/AmiB activator)